ncbi:exodeoxyribonuclease VII small subunit [Oscillospiraceae bacterium OttesenSCG-928-G22]|nr:exodeoxyribonuclease VII small subunit [Oscillospiraceae bacterium OttesenSCG-928-G22]
MAEKFSFEAAVSRLEEIVKLLERGDVSVDESLKLFEEGAALTKKLNTLLDKAEQKVKVITKGQDGPEQSDFGPLE